MTKTFCDLCKLEMPQGVVYTKLRIDNLLHDFCDDCWTKLKTLLEGTGIQVQDPIYVPGSFPGQGWNQTDVLPNPFTLTPFNPNIGVIMTGTMNAGSTAANVTDLSGMVTLNMLMTDCKELFKPSACLLAPEAV
jgi:hypothetical protein